ncbi:MAG TPA: 16S rRNA (guanine(527)-N(7))-methyltransferase RsmG [Sulfurivirga caldicuralii]|nr:16S rRNA (guanine(527)-N(7))-methyltransferase RsmG [Sulfurivirga caldicuralii]
MNHLHYILLQGSEQLGLELSTAQQQQLLDYVALLHKWNQAYNLTAIRDPQQILIKHLLDALAVLPYLQGARWLDVGTGPGIPGLVLAVARPQWHFHLLDSNGKKIRFVRQAIRELGLENVTPVQARVEQYQVDTRFEGIISRAFAELGPFVRLTRHLLAPAGCWWAMKGHGEREVDTLPQGVKVARIVDIAVPFLTARRTLVVLKEADE